MRITRIAALCVAAFLCVPASALAQTVFTKAQVGDRIRKVEDGVDEFRKWAENRGEQGKTQSQAAQSSGRTRQRTATELVVLAVAVGNPVSYPIPSLTLSAWR